jgi:hypothetical protein
MAGAYQGGGKGPKKRRGQPLGGGSPNPRVKRGVLPFQTDAGDAVMVNSYSERWLKRGFQWVYKDEVIGRTGPLQPGQVVSIVSRDGQDLGTGIWDEGKVEVRRLREEPSSRSWWLAPWLGVDSDPTPQRGAGSMARTMTFLVSGSMSGAVTSVCCWTLDPMRA